MPASVVVGGFFGDCGKGKIISYLSMKDDPIVVARGGVGPNAGHTIVHKQKKYKLRMLPSAILNQKSKLMIGAGVLINPDVLLDEIKQFNVESRVVVDPHCAIIEKKHILKDKKGYLQKKIGTTGSGTGPANADRIFRTSKVAKEIPELQNYLGDVSFLVNDFLNKDQIVIIEGTQGTFLSLFHGTYPYVTSKDVTASAICSDIGIGPKKVKDVVVVFKSYITRVGEGGLPGEISEAEAIKKGWNEIATVTGRIRRAAPFNFDLAKRAVMINSATQIALTKLDILFPESRGLTNYDSLPKNAKDFIQKIEDNLKIPISIIGTGPAIYDVIDRRATT